MQRAARGHAGLNAREQGCLRGVGEVLGSSFWGQEIGLPPPENNELVLSIRMGCADTVPFQPKTNHPVLTRPISNPQNPFPAYPRFWSPGGVPHEDRVAAHRHQVQFRRVEDQAVEAILAVARGRRDGKLVEQVLIVADHGAVFRRHDEHGLGGVADDLVRVEAQRGDVLRRGEALVGRALL